MNHSLVAQTPYPSNLETVLSNSALLFLTYQIHIMRLRALHYRLHKFTYWGIQYGTVRNTYR